MISEVGSNIILTIITYWSWWGEVPNQQDKFARTLLTVLVPSLIFVWYKWRLSYSRKAHLPPGPYGLPVIGYLPFLSSNLHEKFTEIAHTYGPIFSLQLGSKLHVVVNSMDLAKVVAREQDNTFANRSPPITGLTITYGGMDLVWSNNNAHWRSVRKLLVSQVLSNANINTCQGLRIHEVRKTVNEVYNKIGTKIDINKTAFDTELNVVTNMLWGCSKSNEGGDFGDIMDGFREVEFKIIELMGTPNISDFIPLLSWFDLQGMNKEMKRQLEQVEQIFNYIIDKKIKLNSSKIDETCEEDGRKDFLEILLELKDQKNDPKSFNIIHIKALLIGTVVYINVWAIQRDPENWNNPLEFKPERFLSQKWDYNGNNFKFLPFGSGRRICPGFPLGEKMLVYILASLLHSFEWSLPKDEEFELSDEFGFVTKKRKPLIAIPSQSLSDASLYF